MKTNFKPKFYIVCALLLCCVAIGWYGIYFLNTNEILMDSGPMPPSTKAIFTVLTGAVVISWTVSLLALIRQICVGCAFRMDENGIHTTATAIMVLAFIFVVPVKTIPYDAIEQISENGGILSIRLDKSKIKVAPIFRLLVNKEYHFFFGYTSATQANIREMLDRFKK